MVNCFSTVSIGLVPVPICVTFVISAGDNTYNKRIHDIITAFIRHLTTSMGRSSGGELLPVPEITE